MLNPNSYVTMDKKSVTRAFGITTVDRANSGVHTVLIMQSVFEGEYGPIFFIIHAELDGSSPELHCEFAQTSGESIAELCSIRLEELLYFSSNILPLFHPSKLLYNEVPLSPAPESQNP